MPVFLVSLCFTPYNATPQSTVQRLRYVVYGWDSTGNNREKLQRMFPERQMDITRHTLTNIS
ncbi:hypothetical protein SF123566_9861 [Shigella flexneri 1235-66]|nr:hypothetical protein SF123566_9861 [Shigella flexneri 1235-66]